MQLTNELVHDEINLFRLVRRLEKSVQVEGDDAEVWVRSQKELQVCFPTILYIYSMKLMEV